VNARIATIFATRGLRGFADGLMSAGLASLLVARGFRPKTVGQVSTATLLGSAFALLLITRYAHILRPYRVLIVMSVLMAITGMVFAFSSTLWVLIAISLIGPLNPSSGDVSPLLPAEQTVLGSTYEGTARTTAMARFSLVALAGASLGAFLLGPIKRLGHHIGMSADGVALAPLIYAGIGLAVLPAYLVALRSNQPLAVTNPSKLGVSKRVIYELTAVFSLDSAGGGMVIYSIVALWLNKRFGFSAGGVGAVLGLMSLASAASALLAPRISARIGLVETMVVTHLPSNVLIIAAAFAPNAKVAVALLIARSLLSQMDVPPRVSFVMSLVTPEERSAASAFTNLPRSIAAASTPLIGGWLIEHSSFGWPLVIGGILKMIYDVLLWVRFRGRSIRA
jgi:predicted MFS family arabinose efflux permease